MEEESSLMGITLIIGTVSDMLKSFRSDCYDDWFIVLNESQWNQTKEIKPIPNILPLVSLNVFYKYWTILLQSTVQTVSQAQINIHVIPGTRMSTAAA